VFRVTVRSIGRFSRFIGASTFDRSNDRVGQKRA
jgi:hypothetical protein